MEKTGTLFFDPFAESGEELFDAAASFDAIAKQYIEGDVRHDYTADKFLKDTQSLMLDAHFLDQFDKLAYIASQMHVMCAHDQQLQSLAYETGIVSEEQTGSDAGHDHEVSHDEKADSKKKKTKKENKEKRKNTKKHTISGGWLSIIWQNVSKDKKQ